MPIAWFESIDGLDGNELTALYRAAPLGRKNARGLQMAFTNLAPERSGVAERRDRE